MLVSYLQAMLAHDVGFAQLNLPFGEIQSTPLIVAAERGGHGVAEVLLNSGADPNMPNMNQVTPLHAAVTQGHYGCVTALLQHAGTNVNAKDWKGLTPIYLAVQHRRTEMLEGLLARGANANMAPDPSPSLFPRAPCEILIPKCLGLAAGGGNPEMVNKLLALLPPNPGRLSIALHFAARGSWDEGTAHIAGATSSMRWSPKGPR